MTTEQEHLAALQALPTFAERLAYFNEQMVLQRTGSRSPNLLLHRRLGVLNQVHLVVGLETVEETPAQLAARLAKGAALLGL